jgi:hypothetical protein
VKTVDVLIVLAKFAYHSQSNKDFNKNYQDIPLVSALKNLRSSLRAENKQSRTQKHNSISWSEVIQVREALRKEAEILHHKPEKKNPKGKKRTLSGIARTYQKFLFLAFLTVVPPDRKQTLDNLTIGNTLKHGLFANNRFIPANELAPGEAKFYIHQGLGDYKTSKTYGEWLGELNNEVYPDGKTFYEYLERWLYYGFQDEQGNWHGLREAMVLRSKDKRIKNTPKTDPTSHNYFFIGTKGNKINSSTIYNTFQDVFYKFTNGITISPHDLRHILRTHIKDIGASLQEQESAAYWMKQSLKSAEEHYTHQEREKKMRPASNLMQRINQECLQEISRKKENSD